MAKPLVTLASVPTAEGPLDLKKRGERDFLITINGRILMTSSAHRSEDALSVLACGRLANAPRPRVLISGLGMGYTLRAALDALPASAEVVVVELNPVVVDWCRGPMAVLTNDALSDKRVSVVVDDVAKYMRRKHDKPFDGVILDMYAGPLAKVPPDDPLYSTAASANVARILSKNGVYAVWSEASSKGYERCLEEAGFQFELHRSGHGARIHAIYLASRA